MEELIRDILDALRTQEVLDAASLDKIIRRHSKKAHDGRRVFAKKHVLAAYLASKEESGSAWKSWHVDEVLDRRFIATMKMKPRRTASGVATITVITKPWACAGTCIYCPNDVRMPKSYLHDEPACQRAERNWFDPYLQVAARLKSLENMGHDTDKVELIVLGGSWTDYPKSYRIWFAKQLYKALNDSVEERTHEVEKLREVYEDAGVENDYDKIAARVAQAQASVNEGSLTYNEAITRLYTESESWRSVSLLQVSTLGELHAQQEINETANHRVVGLVFETRPDSVSAAMLAELRMLGCTKIQLGVQSIDEKILALNGRPSNPVIVERALGLSRLFGYKTHTHFMVNLLGATPESDKEEYAIFANDPRFSPDETKIYPCALVDGTKLVEHYKSDDWRPYTEEELIDVLAADMRATPPYMRVSRMIRDISAKDILVGNKKTNLRQLVDEELAADGSEIDEIRFREIGTQGTDLNSVVLDDVVYQTTLTTEHFLQWVDGEGRIAGFLRLSLPRENAFDGLQDLPDALGGAMIREVHVYGFAAKIDEIGASAQHHGLGKTLVEHACELASDEGFSYINVISAVGTRGYYRKLGFEDCGLYQTRALT